MACNLCVQDFSIGGLHDPETDLCRTPSCQYSLVGLHPVRQQGKIYHPLIYFVAFTPLLSMFLFVVLIWLWLPKVSKITVDLADDLFCLFYLFSFFQTSSPN